MRTATVIYTDGSCSPNPGPGGYGVYAVLGNGARKTFCGGYRLTTNNRMEIIAVIEALKVAPKDEEAIIYSDSQYVVNAFTKGWAVSWRQNGWWRSQGQRARNRDLWNTALTEIEARGNDVDFRWVRGHSGNPGNEKADELARIGRSLPNPIIDSVYEGGESHGSPAEQKVINDFAERVLAVKEENEGLGKYRGRRLRFAAVVDSLGEMTSYGYTYPTILLKDICLLQGAAGEKRVAVLLWFKKGKWAATLKPGTRFCFNARVGESSEGWRLERPGNVSFYENSSEAV